MNAIEKHQIVDTRETLEVETRYNTFEDLMLRVDAGELSFEEAVTEYKDRELGAAAISAT